MPPSKSMPTPTKKSFTDYVSLRKELIEEGLDRFLTGKDPDLLYKSMRYSVLAGGKRLRALLALASFESIKEINSQSPGAVRSQDSRESQNFGGMKEGDSCLDEILPVACAIEMVHAMSLVHDDLPCLDNDDLRRGRPTNHRVFGDAIALLAGDALLMQAVETIIVHSPSSIERALLLDVVRGLTRATGAEGMVGGQVFDLIYTGQLNLPETVDENVLAMAERDAVSLDSLSSAENYEKAITPETVKVIHSRKTGALIKYSLWAGARIARASEEQLDGIDRFGELLGLAFQIADDLLDVTGDIKTLGKTPGKDERSDKATWIKVFGVDGARKKLESLHEEGRQILINSNLDSQEFPVLSQLLEFAIVRTS